MGQDGRAWPDAAQLDAGWHGGSPWPAVHHAGGFRALWHAVYAQLERGRIRTRCFSPGAQRIQTGGDPAAFKAGSKYQGLIQDFGEAPMANSFQFDAIFEDGALYKHGK